jgi:predicted RNase H-like HicB family nuclease
MAEVIYLSQMQPIPPKSVAGIHLKQRFSCTFDPNASPDERWVWVVSYTEVFKFYGAASSLQRAQQQARKRIEKMVSAHQRAEENE